MEARYAQRTLETWPVSPSMRSHHVLDTRLETLTPLLGSFYQHFSQKPYIHKITSKCFTVSILCSVYAAMCSERFSIIQCKLTITYFLICYAMPILCKCAATLQKLFFTPCNLIGGGSYILESLPASSPLGSLFFIDIWCVGTGGFTD